MNLRAKWLNFYEFAHKTVELDAKSLNFIEIVHKIMELNEKLCETSVREESEPFTYSAAGSVSVFCVQVVFVSAK